VKNKRKLRKIKKNNEKNIKIQKFISVMDDWYPNYENNKVRIFLLNSKLTGYEFVRIGVHGNDDFGLEMDFKGTLEENNLKFEEWKKTIYDNLPKVCSKEYFIDLGFYNA
jgi:hypothetical protein